MKEFILVLLGVSVISGLASMLTPEGKGGGLRSYVAFTSALCALSITVSPLLSFINTLSDGGEREFGFSFDTAEEAYEEIFDSTLEGYSKKRISAGVCQLVRQEFGIDEENIDVDVILCEEEDSVESVSVILRGAAVLSDAKTIEAYVEKLLLCECKIVYGGKSDE